MIQKWHALEISILKAAESSEEVKVNYQLYFLITIFFERVRITNRKYDQDASQ